MELSSGISAAAMGVFVVGQVVTPLINPEVINMLESISMVSMLLIAVWHSQRTLNNERDAARKREEAKDLEIKELNQEMRRILESK